MAERPLDRLEKTFAMPFEPTEVIPGDGGTLDENLADGRGLDLAKGRLEVVHRHFELVEHRNRDRAAVEIDVREISGQAGHRGLAAKRGDIGADESVSVRGDDVEVDFGIDRHASSMNFEDLASCFAIGDRQGDFAVEPAGASQGGIERVGKVGGGENDDLRPLRQAVHQRQELGHDALLDVAHNAVALWRDGVDLVQKDDRWRLPSRLLEHLAELRLALSVEFMDDLGAVDREERSFGFMGDRPGDQRFAATGRAVEQHSLGRSNAEPREELGELQRQLDDLSDTPEFPL